MSTVVARRPLTVQTPSIASVASYPPSEAGSTAPSRVTAPVSCSRGPWRQPLTAQSHQVESEVALATSKKQLHAVTPQPPTPQPAPTFEPGHEVRFGLVYIC